jgi:DNA-directed RNA polymerase specialized sigma24 family protein
MTHASVIAHHERALVVRATGGDADAFHALIRPHDRGLRGLAYRLLGDRQAMDDALQESYLKAFRAMPRFEGDSAFKSWLYRRKLRVRPRGHPGSGAGLSSRLSSQAR